jgi:hypothetical protein
MRRTRGAMPRVNGKRVDYRKARVILGATVRFQYFGPLHTVSREQAANEFLQLTEESF